MPYVLVKDPKKKNHYWVVTEPTGRKHSILSLPKSVAMKQMSALYAVEGGYKMKRKHK